MDGKENQAVDIKKEAEALAPPSSQFSKTKPDPSRIPERKGQ